jgi:hypothetical protein
MGLQLTFHGVWGGGIYEEDVFYDICDELGILVWQDFMFGCGSYPTWPSLLESIRNEAVCNVRRLRHHPSIVIYTRNNEDYQIQEWYKLDYDWENKDTGMVEEHVPSEVHLRTPPANGDQGRVAKCCILAQLAVLGWQGDFGQDDWRSSSVEW